MDLGETEAMNKCAGVGQQQFNRHTDNIQSRSETDEEEILCSAQSERRNWMTDSSSSRGEDSVS
jgi:hypothetical protein